MKHTTMPIIRFLLITPMKKSGVISHSADMKKLHHRLHHSFDYIQTTDYTLDSSITEIMHLLPHLINHTYEYVHVHSNSMFILTAVGLFSKITRSKIICSIHKHQETKNTIIAKIQSYIKPYMLRWIIYLFDVVIALDTSTYKYLLGHTPQNRTVYCLDIDAKTIQGETNSGIQKTKYYFWDDLVEQFYILIKHHSIFNGSLAHPLSY